MAVHELSLYQSLVKIQGTMTNEISLKRQELGLLDGYS